MDMHIAGIEFSSEELEGLYQKLKYGGTAKIKDILGDEVTVITEDIDDLRIIPN